MKQRQLNKKLSLNKKTISTLNVGNMENAKGGAKPICEWSGSCKTDLHTCGCETMNFATHCQCISYPTYCLCFGHTDMTFCHCGSTYNQLDCPSEYCLSD